MGQLVVPYTAAICDEYVPQHWGCTLLCMKGFKSYVSQNNYLPSHSSAILEKHQLTRSTSFFTVIAIPLPSLFARHKHSHVNIPIPFISCRLVATRPRYLFGLAALGVGIIITLYALFCLHKFFPSQAKDWLASSGESQTLVFSRDDLRKIWQWEISSGHYPSNRRSKVILCFLFERINSVIVKYLFR